jgi:hypothetical protein
MQRGLKGRRQSEYTFSVLIFFLLKTKRKKKKLSPAEPPVSRLLSVRRRFSGFLSGSGAPWFKEIAGPERCPVHSLTGQTGRSGFYNFTFMYNQVGSLCEKDSYSIR